MENSLSTIYMYLCIVSCINWNNKCEFNAFSYKYCTTLKIDRNITMCPYGNTICTLHTHTYIMKLSSLGASGGSRSREPHYYHHGSSVAHVSTLIYEVSTLHVACREAAPAAAGAGPCSNLIVSKTFCQLTTNGIRVNWKSARDDNKSNVDIYV